MASRRWHRARWVAVGVSTGLLYWLAMPGVGWGLLGFVAFLPLYLYEAEKTTESLALGFVAGVVATLGVCAWLPSAMRQMLNASPALGALGLAAICTWHGVRFAAVSVLNHRARRVAVPGCLRLPLSLIAAELLVPVPFPFSLAVTVHALPILSQIADLGGRMGIVLVLGATTAALGEVIGKRWRRGAIALVPLLATLAYGSIRGPQVERAVEKARTLSVGLVQVDVAPSVKRDNPALSFGEHVRLTHELLTRRVPDLIVWSETAMSMPLDDRLLPSGLGRRFGSEFPAPVLLGAVLAHDAGAGGVRSSNSALLATGDGFVCPTCRYDKQTLVPLAEALPWHVASHPSTFAVGNHDRALPFDDQHLIGVLICFEAIFPESVRQLVRRDQPQLLVNLTNDGWFGASDEPRLHLALAKLRAIESRRFLVRVAATGISAIVDPLGRTVLTIPAGARDAKVGTVAWLDGSTYYDAIGDTPWWLLTVLLVAVGFSRRRSVAGAADGRREAASAAQEQHAQGE